MSQLHENLVAGHGDNRFGWPFRIPDLNLIENLCGVLHCGSVDNTSRQYSAEHLLLLNIDQPVILTGTMHTHIQQEVK